MQADKEIHQHHRVADVTLSRLEHWLTTPELGDLPSWLVTAVFLGGVLNTLDVETDVEVK
jgi:hypothetical protein